MNMKTVSIRQLRSNPSEAVREARRSPVVIVNRDQPVALLVHLDDEALFTEPGVRLALATSLYRDKNLSLGQAARFARLTIAEFMQHVSRLGIPVVLGTAATLHEDAEAIAARREGTSRPTRAR